MKQLSNNPARVTTTLLALFLLIGLSTVQIARADSPFNATHIVDLNGDGFSDLLLVDSDATKWLTYDFFSGDQRRFDFGTPGSRQVIGDYDGDGLSDFAACYDNGLTGLKLWRIELSSTGAVGSEEFQPQGDIAWGLSGDVPVPADYDGDGKTDLATFNPYTGVWDICLSKNKSRRVEQFGLGSDNVVPADYDGDGMADIAVMRASDNTWYIHYSRNDALGVIFWAVKTTSADVMVPADYDGDGLADMAMYKAASGFWTIIESGSGNTRTAQFGAENYSGDTTEAEPAGDNADLPTPGDFDGDGVIDLAVWSSKSMIAHVLPSQSSVMTSLPVGSDNSIPVSLSVFSRAAVFPAEK